MSNVPVTVMSAYLGGCYPTRSVRIYRGLACCAHERSQSRDLVHEGPLYIYHNSCPVTHRWSVHSSDQCMSYTCQSTVKKFKY